MNKTIQVYILNVDSAYEGDFSHKIRLFTNQSKAIEAYRAAVKDTLDSCMNDDDTPPIDITGLDPDFDKWEGSYVKEIFESGTDEDPTYSTIVYLYGEYADDHTEVSLKKEPLEIEGQSFGLTNRKIHNKI